MGEVLKRKPQVGDTLLYVGQTNDYLTHDKMYIVQGVDIEDGEPYVFDDDGDNEYIRPHQYANFHTVSLAKDPGMIDISDDFGVDTTGTTTVRVTVDAKGLETLRALQRDHQRATKRVEIEAKIKALEEELKKI